MTDNDSLKELNYKAIMTLYSYANEQKTATTDILRTIDDIITDTFINKNDIAKIIFIAEKLTTVSELHSKNISDNMRITELMGNCIRDRNDKDDDKNNKLYNNCIEEINIINGQRRKEKLYYLCDWLLIIMAITAVFFYK